jgi:hypothetical protein
LQLASQAQFERVRTGQMTLQLEQEMVAYAVQNVGEGWRWRIYGPHGRLIRQGIERSEAAALSHAEVVFWGQADHRIAA